MLLVEEREGVRFLVAALSNGTSRALDIYTTHLETSLDRGTNLWMDWVGGHLSP
jgi:hypothetical protein